ncbi:MAG: rhodanese-like domain-containing protein [Polyangiales bacterium]
MSFPRVTPSEAARLLREQGYAYLDVRGSDELALGHPEGAYNIPWLLPDRSGPNPRFLALVRATFPHTQKLVVGCQTGRRSQAASEVLVADGYDVVDQRAGFAGERDAFGKVIEPGWERAGLPVAYEPKPGRSYRELSETKPPEPG